MAELGHGRETTIRLTMTRRTAVLVAILALVAACGGGPTPSIIEAGPSIGATPAATAGPIETASGTPAPTVPPTRFDGKVTLADGRSLKARCLGEGTPTILLEVGGSGDMTDWQTQFVYLLAATTTTCLYSRAGGPGSSEPAVKPPTMDSVTSDAFELLELIRSKAGVEGPYVLVGWSLGGSVVLAEALTRPDQTVGIALLDSGLPEDFLANCAADGRTRNDCQAEYDEDIDAKLMESQIAKAIHPLDVPSVLVTAMEYPECVDSPSATQSANLGGTTVTAADCAGLAVVIAGKQESDWRAVLPKLETVRVQADHDGLVASEGRRIAELILAIVREARASS